MPYALAIIGLILVVTGARNTHAALGAQLRGDFTDFVPWIVAIGAIGMLGYVKALEPFSRAFMALIIIAMLVRSNAGFFDRFQDAIAQGPEQVATSDTADGDEKEDGFSWGKHLGGIRAPTAINVPQATGGTPVDNFKAVISAIVKFL